MTLPEAAKHELKEDAMHAGCFHGLGETVFPSKPVQTWQCSRDKEALPIAPQSDVTTVVLQSSTIVFKNILS